MCNFRVFFTAFFVFSIRCNAIFSHEILPFPEELTESIVSKVIGNRLYLQPGVVHLSDKEIFLCAGGTLFPIESVSCDGEGVYIQLNDSPNAWKGACPNGHKNLCGWCRGCLNVCRYRCTCSPFQ